MPVSIPGVKAPEVKKVNKPTVPNKPAMSMQQLPMDKMKQMRGVGAPSRFDKNQEQRNAIKKIAFVDELSKIAGGATALLKAVGKRLWGIKDLATQPAKDIAKKRTLAQLDNASRIGSKRIMRAEDALRNPNQSMGAIAKQSKNLDEGKKLKDSAEKIKQSLNHSYDPDNKKVLTDLMAQVKKPVGTKPVPAKAGKPKG